MQLKVKVMLTVFTTDSKVECKKKNTIRSCSHLFNKILGDHVEEIQSKNGFQTVRGRLITHQLGQILTCTRFLLNPKHKLQTVGRSLYCLSWLCAAFCFSSPAPLTF
ncbi:hypothetical protein XENOCAPTIV_024093 [Xenoophorus captivus]|uniref:Uncharacterized protein n=1 Tax=Xenoophorus captivus TaxID=1517983 RepID=A0ABV0S5A0_9TELE